jgi:glycosyltransferase involved in cell wall biosynthesis
VAISAVIPAYNEAQRIGNVIQSLALYVDETLVVDDGSKDNTAIAAQKAGARVIHQEHNGYNIALKRGFWESKNDIIVTIDADGEHCASDIPRLAAPVVSGDADLVLGIRPKHPRISESFINWLTNLKVSTGDACTGFRALRKELALRLSLKGPCTCGTFVLEADYFDARIVDVPIITMQVNKKRSIAWYHIRQTGYILAWLLRRKRRL